MKVPMSFPSMELDPLRFSSGQRLGGLMPRPNAPGVDAMLTDGWVWTGRDFARDQKPEMDLLDVRVVAVEGIPATRNVFIRVGPVGDPRIGQYRGDADGGDAALVPGRRWGTIWGPEEARRGEVGRWGARDSGRYAGHLSSHRVLAGRYADRLPTNRKRKRERAKANRRRKGR